MCRFRTPHVVTHTRRSVTPCGAGGVAHYGTGVRSRTCRYRTVSDGGERRDEERISVIGEAPDWVGSERFGWFAMG